VRCLLILAGSAAVFLASAPLGGVVLLAACLAETRRVSSRWENDR
jgi:hypothetical protein